MIEIRINGQPRTVAEGITVAELLASLGLADKPIIVEKNGVVVNAAVLGNEPVLAKDSLELIQLMGGG